MNNEPASEAKRIEREAKDYADNNYKKNHYPDNWENSHCGYIAGANEEHNRAQEEITRLKAELEREREKVIKECIEKLTIHQNLIEVGDDYSVGISNSINLLHSMIDQKSKK